MFMIPFIYALFFGFWGCQTLKDGYAFLVFSIFLFVYLFLRFQKKSFLFIPLFLLSLFLHVLPQTKPTLGDYTIYEIHTNYCLAQKEKASIVVYGLEDADYYDIVHVSYLEELESLKNLNLFDFSEYMEKEGIHQYTNVSQKDILSKSNSIKARIYRKCKKNPLYLQYFYGIYEEGQIESIYTSLGLGFLSFTYILRWILERFLDTKTSQRIVLFISILHGSLFVYTASLVRTILSQLFQILIKNPHIKLCTTYFFFLLLYPSKTTSFVCVFPFFLQWLSLLEKDEFKRKVNSFVFMIGIQLFYFHKVNLISILCFGMARKLLGIFYLLLLLPFISSIVPSLHSLLLHLPKLEFIYVPSFLFLFLFVFYFIQKRKGKTILILFFLICFESHLNPFFHVYMINIGQGDCTLIVEPYQKSAVLIDCGQNLNRDNVTQIVLPFIKNLQIQKLDGIVVTHEDFDHSGGVKELSENMEVKEIVTKRKENLVNYPFYFLLEDRNYEEENDNSLITYFSYDGFGYLWTGDASIKMEKECIQKYDLSKTDVFKLGHHGSSTSTCLELLESTIPKLGLISVGKHNYYGHPSSEVVGRCHDFGVNLLQTKDVGTIHLFSLPHFLFFETANGYIGLVKANDS